MNIRKIIEEEINRLLSEDDFDDDAGKSAAPAAAAPAAPAQPKPAAPAAQAEKYQLKTTGRGFATCRDVAEKIQTAARSALSKFVAKETDKKAIARLIRRISDNKLGNTTLSIVNAFADAAGIEPLPFNQTGYKMACRLKPAQVDKIIAAMNSKTEEIVQIARRIPVSYAQSAASSGAAVINADQLPLNVLQPLRTVWYKSGVDKEDSFTKLYKKDNKWFFQGLQPSDTYPVPESFYQTLEAIIKPAAAPATPTTAPISQQPVQEKPVVSGSKATYQGSELDIAKNARFAKTKDGRIIVNYVDGKNAVIPTEEYNSATKSKGFDEMDKLADLAAKYYPKEESKSLRGMILKELLSTLK
jgi:hypothetical protein